MRARQGKLKAEFPSEERAVTTEAPAPAAGKAIPAAARPSVTSPMGTGDDLKAAPGAKAALGGEVEARPVDTLTEKEGKLAAGKGGGGGIPVRLDNASVQREQAAGADPGWDSSNAARVADARRGFGIQGRAES